MNLKTLVDEIVSLSRDLDSDSVTYRKEVKALQEGALRLTAHAEAIDRKANLLKQKSITLSKVVERQDSALDTPSETSTVGIVEQKCLVHTAALDLVRAEGGRMKVSDLCKGLLRGGALGFGVEPEDVISSLIRRGTLRLDYDSLVIPKVSDS